MLLNVAVVLLEEGCRQKILSLRRKYYVPHNDLYEKRPLE